MGVSRFSQRSGTKNDPSGDRAERGSKGGETGVVAWQVPNTHLRLARHQRLSERTPQGPFYGPPTLANRSGAKPRDSATRGLLRLVLQGIRNGVASKTCGIRRSTELTGEERRHKGTCCLCTYRPPKPIRVVGQLMSGRSENYLIAVCFVQLYTRATRTYEIFGNSISPQ